jgi:hypothetical protein
VAEKSDLAKIEITDKMLRAGVRAYSCNPDDLETYEEIVARIFVAMLSKAMEAGLLLKP